MNLQELFSAYQGSERIQEIAGKLTDSTVQRLHLTGLVGSAEAIVAANLFLLSGKTQLFIFNQQDDAKYFATDLENILEGKTILFLPPSYKRAFQVQQPESSQVLDRAEVLNRLHQKQDQSELIVTTAEAVCELVISESDLQRNTYELKTGSSFDLDFFIEFLSGHHFERSDFVYEAGQFSIRGGIIDIFSFSNPHPYRIELNGELIESIRVFNPETQLSEKRIDRFFIIPNIRESSVEKERKLFFDYLPQETCVWVHDFQLSLDQIRYGIEKASAATQTSEPGHEGGSTEPVERLFATAKDVESAISGRTLIEVGSRTCFGGAKEVQFHCSPQPAFHKNFSLLIQNLKSNQAAGLQNLIFSDSSRQVERLYTIFEDLEQSDLFAPVYHSVSNGFIDHDLKLACYTEHQVFDRFYRGHQRSTYNKNRLITLKELRDLKPGDFVTHIDHGIGKFAGLEKMEVNGHLQEVVRLVYRDNDLLYVGIHSLHKISRYVGKDGTEPRVHKLGSDVWEKVKSNTKRKVKDIARDLIKLYAKRKAQQGFAFAPDNYMQVELEASFMYEDTPDQSKATIDVKQDMESRNPMDRLVCGDVGFGKTEVAIRAAFKAVCDSKQVAVLVPTTILANQHYRTFKERLKDFPCSIDYLNRFKSAAEQKAILQKAKEGKLDILIGTHKLLSKELKFKDLGLLIIDEEQKFGVAAKEKLKALKINVDTLTLTATPIPRTLHFSLMGARDLSIINTPPANRQPVTTELHNFNDEFVKEVIMHEVDRGGQVFVVHHRVKDIYDLGDRIRVLCPGIRVGVAHGQLAGDQLEDVMIRFIEGEYDVLVATTIIESGLDIPNANTIIINNAHMFGLSDIHQMRGRVGRSNRKAYCYLLVPSMLTLTQDARRRLQAIEEFSDLGSGFNVAMRDLDIRGAGNLLGGEQSGFIAEIGFEMYHKILDEAVQELKEEEFSELFKDDQVHKLESKDCSVETDIEAMIPDSYVRNISERLSLYNELSNLHSDEQLNQFGLALTDRFGILPQEVIELLELIRLREAGKHLGLEKLILKNNTLGAYFPDEKKQSYYQSDLFAQLLKYVQQNAQRCKMKQKGNHLVLSVHHVTDIRQARKVLEEMYTYCKLPFNQNHER